MQALGEAELAIKILKLAEKVDPENPHIYFMQGLVLRGSPFNENHDAEAIRLFEKAIEVGPKHADAHGQLARVLANSNDKSLRSPAKALRHARICRELRGNPPPDVYELATLAMAEYRNGTYSEASEHLHKAQEGQNDTFVSAYAPLSLFLAVSYWQLGNEEEARRWFDRANTQGKSEVSMFHPITFKVILQEAKSMMGHLEDED